MGFLTGASRAERRYMWRTILAMAVFAVTVPILSTASGNGAIALLHTAILALPILVVAYEFQHYVRALDEMQSGLELKAAAIGFGLTLVGLTIWSLAARFELVPAAEAAFALPVAVVLHSLVRFIQNRRLD